MNPDGKNLLDEDGKWKTLVFSGSGQPGLPGLPGQLCSVVPTLCSFASNFDSALSCRDGIIKLSVLEGQAHVRPHCGITNAKLSINLPLVVPQDGASVLVMTYIYIVIQSHIQCKY